MTLYRTGQKKPGDLPDVAKAKRNPVYFTEKFLGHRLFPHQKRVLKCKASTVVHVAGRGSGKTVEGACLAAWFLFTKKRSTVVYISARERQGKIARDELLGLLAGTELFPDIIESSYEKVKFSNGSVIYFLPGSSSVAARGLHNKLVREGEAPTSILLILDESANIPRETYVAAMSILNTAAKKNRKRLVLGSPLGTNSWFYTEHMAGLDEEEKHTQSFHTNSEDCPHISKQFLEEMKTKLTPVEYAAEIKAEFQEALNSFFAGYVESAIRQYVTPLPCDFDEGVEYSLGIDLSSSSRIGSDFTVLVVVERWRGGLRREVTIRDWQLLQRTVETPPYIRIADIRRFQYLDHAGLKRELQDILRCYPGLKRVSVETYESTQLEAIVGYGKDKLNLKLDRLSPTNPLQREMFSHFHQLLRDGVLQLPYDGSNVKQLRAEMANFQMRVTDAGNVTFGAIEENNEKDDCVYALGWALWNLRVETKHKAKAYYKQAV